MKSDLKEIASVFFKLGCIAFGGPAAHIAMMEEEVVNKRKWMDRAHFLDLIGATNLIPGPNSTEMTMHCGHERGGWPGLFVAGLSFIIPAVLTTGILAWLYATYGTLPEVSPFIFGIKPAVLAIITSAVIKLGKKAVKTKILAILGVLVMVAGLLGVNEITALLVAGLVGILIFSLQDKITSRHLGSVLPLLLLRLPSMVITKMTVPGIFWIFLKVGALLYGSGYVLFAYLDAELVSRSWLSRQQLMDAVAVGQFTPGPVLSAATFIGYQLDGIWGSLAATAGIFLPSFILVLLLNPLVPRMRKSKIMAYFLDSVNVAAVAVMAGVLIDMGRESLMDWKALIIGLISFIITFGFKRISAMWTVMLGATLGYILWLI